MVARRYLKYIARGYFALFVVTISVESSAGQQESCIKINNYASSQKDAWWIAGASLRDRVKHESLASQMERGNKPPLGSDDLFPIKGHALGDGRGDVLVYRDIFEGWSWMSDSGDFTQITIVTPKPLVGSGEILIGGPSGAMVFYTGGVPSFRNYCFGYAATGKIAYNASTPDTKDISNLLFSKLGVQSGVWAKISAQFILGSSDSSNQECDRCIFNANLIFQPRSISFVNQELEK